MLTLTMLSFFWKMLSIAHKYMPFIQNFKIITPFLFQLTSEIFVTNVTISSSFFNPPETSTSKLILIDLRIKTYVLKKKNKKNRLKFIENLSSEDNPLQRSKKKLNNNYTLPSPLLLKILQPMLIRIKQNVY